MIASARTPPTRAATASRPPVNARRNPEIAYGARCPESGNDDPVLLEINAHALLSEAGNPEDPIGVGHDGRPDNRHSARAR